MSEFNQAKMEKMHLLMNSLQPTQADDVSNSLFWKSMILFLKEFIIQWQGGSLKVELDSRMESLSLFAFRQEMADTIGSQLPSNFRFLHNKAPIPNKKESEWKVSEIISQETVKSKYEPDRVLRKISLKSLE